MSLRFEEMDHAEVSPACFVLRPMESYLKDMGMADQASAWAMVKRRPKEYCRKLDAATRCSSVCPPYLT